MSEISAAEHPKSKVEVLGHSMTYVDLGSGNPVVFLHGNPTSSYLWRNIMPYVADTHRAIAPDLIGMGDSDKLSSSGPDRYTFAEHREFLNGFMDAIVPDEPIILVIHDWGSALGFDWAKRNPDRVKGICFMEGIVGPINSWDDWPEAARDIFQAFRSDAGEELILEKNLFIEAVLPGSILRKITEEEMGVYRRPFAQTGEARRPTLSWPRQIPIAGEPRDVTNIVTEYAQWLSKADLPKLFINAEPGAILLDPARKRVRSWPNLKEVTVSGSHFIQEDSPHEIGSALKEWMHAKKNTFYLDQE
ncbi:MAG: haloalkane dehalogenase [Pseudomonadota bacterium]